MRHLMKLFLLILLFISCSSENDQTLFDSAKSFEQKEKFSDAIKNYEKIISDYPESKFRAEVLFNLAKMYQARLDKSVNELDSYKRAKKYFHMVYKEFPKNENAASSLFMVGFIQANLLNQLDSAKLNYEKFIQQFPNHPMVESAKAEVQNLGIPADKIIMKEERAK